MATLQNNTIPFISDQLDAFFEQFGVPFISTIAIVAIVFGLFIAFFGARGQGPKVLAFVAGFMVGAYGGALVLEALDNQNQNISTEVWLGGFVASGVFVGIICVCIVIMAKLVFGVATGLVVAGVFFQAGFADLITNEYALIGIVIGLCLISMYLAYKLIDLLYAILASFLGGALVALGSGSFTESPITLNLLTSDPESAVELCQQSEEKCYIPLGIGVGIAFVALIYNLIGYRRKSKQKQKNQETRERNDELVAQMREDREGFEQQLQRIEQRNAEVLRTVQLAGTQQNANPDPLSFRTEMQKQQKGLQVLEEKLATQEAKDSENDKAIQALKNEKAALQEQIEQANKEHEVELKMAALNAEDPEAEKKRKALMAEIQADLAQMKVRVVELDNDFKQSMKLEKSLNIVMPKGLKKRRFNYFESDDDYEQEVQEVYELKQRAEEFTKMKILVSGARKNQKKSLKEIKKRIRGVENLSHQLRRMSLKNFGNDYEKTLKHKKQKEYAMTDLTIKMNMLKTLMERYEETNDTFCKVIGVMEEKLEEFKEAELALETAAIIRRENINGLFEERSQAASQRSSGTQYTEAVSADVEQGVFEEVDSNRERERIKILQEIAAETNDFEEDALSEIAQEFDLPKPPPGPKVWRERYFERPRQPTNQEVNTYFVEFIRNKYPNTLGKLNIFGNRVKEGVVTAGGKIVQKTKEYREHRRSARSFMVPETDVPVSADDMEVLQSPQRINFTPQIDQVNGHEI